MNRPLVAFIYAFSIAISGAYVQGSVQYATPYTITTIGGFAGNSGYDDGFGNHSRFLQPWGITVDANSNLFVADTYNCAIRKIDTNGEVTTFAGGVFISAQGQVGIAGSSDGVGTNARFRFQQGIATDGNGNLFVADTGNATARKIDSNGVVTTIAGQVGVQGYSDGVTTNALFHNPAGIAVDVNGNLFVADSVNNSIRKIDINGVVTSIAGQTGLSGSSDGVGANAHFNNPLGIAVDTNGNIFVADNQNYAIRKIDTNGVVTTFAGKGVSSSTDGIGTNAGLLYPRGITLDKNGNLFVVDSNLIRKITPTARVTTLAGKGTEGSADGIGVNARFNLPQGIAVDENDNFYVADTENNLIRKGVPVVVSQIILFGTISKKIYGGSPFNLTATASSALPVTFTSSNTNVATISSNTVTIVGAGSTTITASQTGDPSYKGATPVSKVLTVSRAPQSITFPPIPSRTFGDSSFSLKASAPSFGTVTFTSSNKKVATVSTNTVTIVGAGLTTITASVPASTNYNASVAHQVLIVAKASQPISFTFPSNNSILKVGATPPLFATAPSGLPVTFKSSNTGVITIKNGNATCVSAGTVSITATVAGNGNYLPSSKTNSYTVQ